MGAPKEGSFQKVGVPFGGPIRVLSVENALLVFHGGPVK